MASEEAVEPGVAAAHPDGVGQPGQGLARGAEGHRGTEVVEHPGHLARPDLVVDGGGHRSTSPAGPEEHDGLPPVGQLPGDHVPPPDTQLAEPAGRP